MSEFLSLPDIKKKVFEKWIYYDNPVNKKQCLSPYQDPLPTPRPDIHRKKIMICVWWDQKSVIYYELLEPIMSKCELKFLIIL